MFLVIAFAVAAVCVRLGLWQLDRLHERRAANEVVSESLNRPLVDLNTASFDSELEHRRVGAHGVYDREHEIVIRGRVYRGSPGVHLVTPLLLEGRDTAVLVLRGFVSAPDGVSFDTSGLNEDGVVVVRGIAEPIRAAPDSGERNQVGERVTWRRLDLNAVRTTLPFPVLGVVIRQTPDSSLPEPPHRLEPAALDDGPHLSYAVQWFAFATISVVGALILFFRKRDGQPRVP